MPERRPLPKNGLEGNLVLYTNGMYQGIAWGLYEGIAVYRDPDQHDVVAFWERALGQEWQSQIAEFDFARGFVEGALEVWDKVEDKL